MAEQCVEYDFVGFLKGNIQGGLSSKKFQKGSLETVGNGGWGGR